MNILALIPARGGSKRIPGKNLKILNGKPLISYTIEAAKQSQYINRIVVSTDSEKIASTSRLLGAEAPFLRPSEISRSDSTEMEFFKHTLGWFKEYENYSPDLIVLLYPTSPFRTAKSIDLAVGAMINHTNADSLRSVRLCSEHPYKMWTMKDNFLVPFVQDKNPNMHTASYHLLPDVYIQNASIYITKPSTIQMKGSPVGDLVIPFVMDEIESIDINNTLDFKLAEVVITNK